MSRLTAEYFTDPLCAWSWSNEAYYRKLREDFGDHIEWRHRMGGLVKEWSEAFHDPTYNIRGGDAEAVAAHQKEVALESRVPLDPQYWFDHPYSSTFPLCVAVKAAGLQGFDVEDRYLRRMREAALSENRDLRTPEALVQLATEVPVLDADRFARELDSDEAKAAFDTDWEAARDPLPDARDTKETEGRLRYSFPALVLRNAAGEHRVLDGDHAYEDYVAAIRELAPGLHQSGPTDIEALLRKYRRVTTLEVSVVCELAWPQVEEALGYLLDGNFVRKRLAGDYHMWELVDEPGTIA